MKNSAWEKILSVGIVLVMCAVTFSAATTNVLADEDDGEEKISVSLNPCVATNEQIHMVWQENLTGNYEIYVVNDAQHNYEDILTEAVEELSVFDDKDSQKALDNLNDALNDCLEQDYKHSIDNVHAAVKNLEKRENIELINTLVDAVMDFAKTNILYAEYDLTFNNSYIQEAYQKYYLAMDKYKENNYDAGVEQFKNSYLKLVESYEENDETFNAVDFGKIVRISYTEFDSVAPQIFLNGTINVCWEENIEDETHAYFARSSNIGITWWYFDATEHAYTYLCYAGINPDLLSRENKLLITKTLERIWILDRCHHFYVPITRDGFTIEDKRVYSPIDDPYLTIYDGKYRPPIYIGDKKFYILCRPGPSPKAPDLTVREVDTGYPHPVASSTTALYAYIENIGDAEVSGTVNVDFYEDEVNLGSYSFSHLGCGASTTAWLQWAPSTSGEHTLKVVADAGNNVGEGDESNNELSKSVDVLAHDGDEDTDGLTNYQEVYMYGTNPYNSDTDSDALSDWDEINIYSTRPTKYDTDKDGLSDGEEVRVWNILNENGDGVTRGFYIMLGDTPSNGILTALVDFQPNFDFQVHGVVVYIESTCGDGYDFGVDIYVAEDSGAISYINPVLVKSDWHPTWAVGAQKINFDNTINLPKGNMYTLVFVTKSSDNDGVQDSLFLSIGGSTDVCRIAILSSDGWSDSQYYWGNIDLLTYWTDPNNPDTDGDGLKDGEEVNVYSTNPLSQYSDADSISDGDEITKYYSNPTITTTYTYTDDTRKKLIDSVSGPEKEFATKTPYVDGTYTLTEPYMDEFRLSTYAPYAARGRWTTHVYPVSADPSCTFYVHINLFDESGNTNTKECISSVSLVDINGNPVSFNIINDNYCGDIVVEAANKPANTDYMLSWSYSPTSTIFAGVKINTDYGANIDTARILYVCPEASLIDVKVKGVPPDTVDINTYMEIIDPDADGTKDLFFRGHRIGYTSSMSLDDIDITSNLKTVSGNYLYISGDGTKTCPFSYNIGSLPDSNVHELRFVWRIIKNTGGCFQYYIGEEGWNPDIDDLDGDGLTDAEEANYNTLLPDDVGKPDVGTDPNNPDTDSDGILDGYEAKCGVSVGGWQNPFVHNDRYALLISGTRGFYPEFWYDLEDMYDILKDNYGYTRDNMYVLYGDGSDYITRPDSPITDGDAHKITIENTCNSLGSVIDSNDFLYVWTFDHGGPSTGHVTIRVGTQANIEDIRDDEFAGITPDPNGYIYLGHITAYVRRVVVMQQCGSGGFIDDLSNDRTVIATACRGVQLAWRADKKNTDGSDAPEEWEYSTRPHGEYLYHLQSAFRGSIPVGNPVDADTDNNGYISIVEAFNYAWNHDSRRVLENKEHPQYDDNGDGIGHDGNIPNGGDGNLGAVTYL